MGITIVPGNGPSAGIYVMGNSFKGDYDKGHWIVRRSKDDGRSWATVDDYASSTEPKFGYVGLVGCADPAGNIYVEGNSRIYAAGTAQDAGPSGAAPPAIREPGPQWTHLRHPRARQESVAWWLTPQAT